MFATFEPHYRHFALFVFIKPFTLLSYAII